MINRLALMLAVQFLGVAWGAEANAFDGAALVRATVPTRGCPTAGITGDQSAPAMPKTLVMSLPSAAVGRVAVYRAAWKFGVVGPLGWTCKARSGSSGIALYVAPKGTDFEADAPSGPMIALHLIEGGTSGRFEVAAIGARVFPGLTAYAKKVKSEGVDANRIVFEPFPRDEIARMSDRAVLFRTPASIEGLGTVVDLAPGPGDVRGFALLSGDAISPKVSILSVRLPPGAAALYPAIIAGVIPARFISAGRVPDPTASAASRSLESFE